MNVITKSVQLPDGRTITIETGKVAKQADGAAVLRMGNTVLLATVCAAKDAVPGTAFYPIQLLSLYASLSRPPTGEMAVFFPRYGNRTSIFFLHQSARKKTAMVSHGGNNALFNGNEVFLRQLPLRRFGHRDAQNAILKLGG